MNIYRISQEFNCDYDTYDSAVVIAESERHARMTRPGGAPGDWDGVMVKYDSWCGCGDVKVELIGTTDATERRVVCASYNAG